MNDTTGGLFKSRRFITGLLAALVTLILYFVGKYWGAGLEDVQTVIDVIMPLALILIAAFTVDDTIAEWSRARIKVAEYNLQAAQVTANAYMNAEQIRAHSNEPVGTTRPYPPPPPDIS